MEDKTILTPETVIRASRQRLIELRSETMSAALEAFFGKLPTEDVPSEQAVGAASEHARLTLGDDLLSEECLKQIAGDAPTAAEQSFESAAAPLALPPPQSTTVLPPMRIAAAAAVGALAGLVLLAPISLLIVGSRDAGILVGPPLGAFVLVLIAGWASKSKWLKRALIGVLGVATIFEVWRLVSAGTVWGVLRGRLVGRRSALMRILTYIAIAFVLFIAKRKPVYDRDEYERTIQCAVEHWLDGALILLSSLAQPRPSANDAGEQLDAVTRTLGGKLQELHAATLDNVPVVADELLHEAKRLGFGGMEGPALFLGGADRKHVAKTLIWSVELGDRYDRFGHIEPGDEVTVEREPLVFEEHIKEKGLVRKMRGRQ